MSLRRTLEPLSKYSESPDRYSRRVTRTSSYSMGNWPSELSSTSDTSAMPSGCRLAEPAKITSSGLRARTAFGDCSPRTHNTASATFDFPDPFGPTTTTMPGNSSVEVRAAKDLKPTRSRRRRCKVGLKYARVVVRSFLPVVAARPCTSLLASDGLIHTRQGFVSFSYYWLAWR